MNALIPASRTTSSRTTSSRTANSRGAGRGEAAECDVVVVGARCAGAATAMLLARAGLHVIVLERGREGSDTVSTHALMRGGVLQLHRWGVLDAIIAAGTPPVRRTVFHYRDATAQVSIRPTAGVDAFYAPRRTVLDAALAAAARRAGADLRFGVAVTGLDTDGRGRVTGVTGVTGHGRAGRPLRVRAGLTVGADGIASTVARAVAAPAERVGPTGGSILYGYWAGLPTDGYEWFYRPGASAGMIPTNDGLTCVFVGSTPERVREARAGGTRAGFDALLAAAAPHARPRLAAATPAGPLHGFSGHRSFLRRCWGPGWALVGDAGYFRDPLSTHGITDALRDAELLARAVADAGVAGVDDDDAGLDDVVGRAGDADAEADAEAEALAGYQRLRDRLSAPLLAVSDQLGAYAWDCESLPPLLRGLSSAMSEETETLLALGRAPSVGSLGSLGSLGVRSSVQAVQATVDPTRNAGRA